MSVLLASRAGAVIFYDTGDPTYNTTAPTGAQANSGWQYEGYFGSFLGTMISPDLFITAAHIGVAGSTFSYDNLFSGTGAVNYGIDTTFNSGTGYYNIPGTDLNIFRVTGGTFSTYAPLYTGSSTTLPFVDIGRGTQRGAPVMAGTSLRGWEWGPGDGVARWGQNTFIGAGTVSGLSGTVLGAAFSPVSGQNQMTLSSGDSGGAAFVDVGGVWELAGINYAVESDYSTSSSGPGVNSAIFDGSGLYEPNGSGGWSAASSLPSVFFVSDISASAGAIQGVIDANPVPEPGGAVLAVSALAISLCRRRRPSGR